MTLLTKNNSFKKKEVFVNLRSYTLFENIISYKPTLTFFLNGERQSPSHYTDKMVGRRFRLYDNTGYVDLFFVTHLDSHQCRYFYAYLALKTNNEIHQHSIIGNFAQIYLLFEKMKCYW